MPLDPRIVLGVQNTPIQMESPLDALSKIAYLQQVRMQGDTRAAAAQEALEKAQEAAAKRARQQQIDAALDAAYSGPPDPKTGRPTLDRTKLYAHLPGHLHYALDQQLDEDEKKGVEFQTAKLTRATTQLELDTKRRAFLGSQLRTIVAANYDPQLFAIEIRAAQRAGAIDDENAERLLALPPEQIKPVVDSFIAQAGGAEATKPTLMNVPAGGVVFDPVTQQPVFTNTRQAPTDQPTTPPTVGSFADYVTRYATSLGKTPETLTPADIATAKQQFEAAGRAPSTERAPAQPDYEWVLRNGEAKQIPKGTAQPGDVPYRAPTAADTQEARKFRQATPVLNAVSELSEKINTQQGLLAKMAGGAAKVAAQANYNDDVAEYEALISGFTPLVARALGHTGVLTQQDVDSVKALFPKPGDSKTLRDRKIKRIKSILGELEQDAGGTLPPSHTQTPHRVGDIVTVKGQKVRITKLLPNGQYEGVAVP